jgi:hypothetical protein
MNHVDITLVGRLSEILKRHGMLVVFNELYQRQDLLRERRYGLG